MDNRTKKRFYLNILEGYGNMVSSLINQLRFYDGRINHIDQERLFNFEMKATIERYYSKRSIRDATQRLEDLGPFVVDFTNIMPWTKEIPDVDRRSARLFTIWAEDGATTEVILIVRGFYLLLPVYTSTPSLREYYFYQENVIYYPMVVISSFRTVFKDEVVLSELIDRAKDEIELNWKKVKENVIKNVDSSTDLWKRYLSSFDQIVHFSFLSPSIDRELIEALRMKNYRTTGVMQVLASPTPSFDQAMIESYSKKAKKLMEKYAIKK